jgi:predicted transcriptional regulator of viral defense system
MLLDEIIRIRRQAAQEVFDYQALTEALSGYRKPRDKITKLLASGAIVRVRKGLYCFGEDFRKEPISREYLANLAYGPSYVSLEYALSYHGLIPERVEVITSVTTKRSREFNTPFGTFSYRMLAADRYALGASRQQAGKAFFLIATAEKALIDKAWKDQASGSVRESDYEYYLTEDLRIDLKSLAGLDLNRLQSIASVYDSSRMDALVGAIQRLRRSLNA